MRGSYTFKLLDNYMLKVTVNDTYYCLSMFSIKFTSAHAFESTRNKGRATIFWKVDFVRKMN